MSASNSWAVRWMAAGILLPLLAAARAGAQAPAEPAAEVEIPAALSAVEPADADPADGGPPAGVAPNDAVHGAASGAKFFETEVLPILRAHCFSCHAPEGGREVESEFDLSTREALLRGGASGPAIDEANPADSGLLRAVRYEDYEMPPKGKLPQAQIATLERWVAMGTPWSAGKPVHAGPPQVDEQARQFWSFRPVTRPEVPAVSDPAWAASPVDAFLLAKMEANGVAPSPPVRKTTLLRRVYYTLTGLPPSPDDIAAFLADDSPNAYEKVVDRLLASPQYGERWARHWLDLVRYGETNGYEFDRVKAEVWRYRDYVIRAFNEDKPYDQFVREQIAGDELGEFSADGLIATGFYRLGPQDGGAPDKLQAQFDELDDIMAVTGQVFLGLTVNCARCHDHKIDPFPTADYYRMLSFFRGIDRRGGTRPLDPVAAAAEARSFGGRRGGRGQRQGQGDGEESQSSDYRAKLRELETQITAIEDPLKPHLAGGEVDNFRVPEYRPAIVRLHTPEHISREQLAEYERLLVAKEQLEESRPETMARALCVSETGPRPPQTYVLLRGSPYAEGDPVEPGFPSVLGAATVDAEIPAPERGARTSGRRRVLADWIASDANPLTARVMANRLFHYHFNRGIVRSTSDFGYGGTPPTHPELLDWLASELVANNWQLKPVHKLLVMSQAYRMSSVPAGDSAERDPANDLLSHFELRRLEAEEVRDSILAVSGNLNLKMFGKSIYPEIAKEVLAGQSRPGQGWEYSPPEDQARRSVYIHIKRSLVVPLLAVFDANDPDSSCPVRYATTQPTQSLTMLNSEFLAGQAAILARNVEQQVSAEPGEGEAAFVAGVLARVTQRDPTAAEVERGVEFIERLQAEHGLSRELAATKFCLMAMNLNEFLYVD
jgi:mono/diheme cytochrome c family protein